MFVVLWCRLVEDVLKKKKVDKGIERRLRYPLVCKRSSPIFNFGGQCQLSNVLCLGADSILAATIGARREQTPVISIDKSIWGSPLTSGTDDR